MDIQIDLKDIIIKTQRLILRPFEENDLNDFYEYASVEGVGEMAGWKHHTSIEETKRILDLFIKGKNVFAVVLKENNKVIGSVGLHSSWANDEPEYKELKIKEIGYVLSKSYWGKGLIPEAVKEITNFFFVNLGLEAFSIGHFITNLQSKRVIEKCGFTFIKNSEYYAKHFDKTFEDMKYILFQ